MAYSDFSRAQLINTLNVTLRFQRGAFDREPVVPRAESLDRLGDALRLIRSSPSEKARSEWLIAPALNKVLGILQSLVTELLAAPAEAP